MGEYRYEIKIWGCSILQPDFDNCPFALQAELNFLCLFVQLGIRRAKCTPLENGHHRLFCLLCLLCLLWTPECKLGNWENCCQSIRLLWSRFSSQEDSRCQHNLQK